MLDASYYRVGTGMWTQKPRVWRLLVALHDAGKVRCVSTMVFAALQPHWCLMRSGRHPTALPSTTSKGKGEAPKLQSAFFGIVTKRGVVKVVGNES